MSQSKIPEWLLERYLLGELPEDKMKEVEIQVKKDNELEKKVMKLKKSNKNILDKYPSKQCIKVSHPVHAAIFGGIIRISKGSISAIVGAIFSTGQYFLARVLVSTIMATAVISADVPAVVLTATCGMVIGFHFSGSIIQS